MISLKKYVRKDVHFHAKKDVQKDVLFNVKKHDLYDVIFNNLFLREKISISRSNIFYRSADHSFLR